MDNKTVLCTTAIATVAVFHIPPSGGSVVWFTIFTAAIIGTSAEICKNVY